VNLQDGSDGGDGAALELVLGKLEAVVKRGGYWMAKCPAHPDGTASLKVMRGTKQPVILDCKAGCQTKEVLAALKLTMADVSAPKEQRGEWTPAGDALAVYDYTDETSKLLSQVLRTADKKFSQRSPDARRKSGWAWTTEGVRRVLYRLPKVIAAAAAGEIIYVAEGEKDVHALEAAGVVATCNPGGTGAGWRPEFSEVLRGAIVVIIADKDEPGIKHARAVAASLAGVAKATEILQAAEGKDAADHLCAGHGLGDLRPVSDTSDKLSETRTAEKGPLTSGSDTSDTSDSDIDDVLLAGVQNGAWLSEQDFPPLTYAVAELIPEGSTLLVGPPKAGKSFLILGLLLAVASGGVALSQIDVTKSRPVLYLALEDGDRRMQDRCQSLLEPGEPIPELFSYKTHIEPGTILATVAAWLRRHPDTALVVIDTLGKVMPPAAMGESAYQRDYRVGSSLKALADNYPGLAIVVLHHDRKAASDDFVDSVSGTHGLAGAADTIIVLCRKRHSADGLLKITGRDVPENEYALTCAEGKAWQLDGADLAAAAEKAVERAATVRLSGTSADVLAFVSGHPEGVRARDVVEKFGSDAYQYLGRLTKSEHIDKIERGLYVPLSKGLSEVSEVSEPQVSAAETPENETDTLSEVSETAEDT
jgi:hypothetical protein